MSLFQNSVLNKYLKGLESEKVDKAYERFTSHFHNPTIQENIRNSKEEQYQGEFLIDLFVNVLGYVKNPTPDFNLTTELKNIKGSKKTDGAIVSREHAPLVKALAVIELKGTKTTDLSKVETQAFGYKNNQPGCHYVITSNFEKLRFYIENAVEFEEFNLFQLTRERFDILWLCLSSEFLLKDIPKKIKDESLTQEENITKELYADYASFRNEIFASIQKENPEYDKLTLFKKTQKLLDRFLFIFFAEDRLLLPPNSIRSIVNQWTDLRDKYDEYFPLYDRFQKYFGYMNTGHKGQQHDIFAYNGGLFAPDEILDNIKIDDDLLHKHTVKLSNYDFESEVSVNILGHIFEHSLNDIDEIQAEIQGAKTDKSKTKRKKDGVFYTPKYITKYIVDHTVGKLCEEKKTELDIQEEEYEKERKGRKKATLKKLTQKLEAYRKWLLKMTICDPACGSGAFLNQALEFLILEHKYIDELQAKLFGDTMILSEVENSILENNLFGVDINEESIDIAKLSLWLRTAQKGRKLTSLNNNIKCGNSLIDDPTVAGDKAFNWQQEFPDVFAKGGFDVVIGNPPYLRVQGLRENFRVESKYYESKYESATGRFDIYVLFMENANDLINKCGIITFILPHNFLISDFGSGIRKYFSDNNVVEEIIHFGSNIVFKEASTYTCIITLSKLNNLIKYKEVKPEKLFDETKTNFIDIKLLNKDKWNLKALALEKIFSKLNRNQNKISDIFSNVSRGIVSGADKIFILKGEKKGDLFYGFSNQLNEQVVLESEIIKPLLKGDSLSRYCQLKNDYFIIYPHKVSDKTLPLEETELSEKYPKAYSYLLNFKNILQAKKIKYKTNADFWYSLHNSRDKELLESKKILTPYLSKRSQMSYDTKGDFFHNDKVSFLKLKNENLSYEYFLGIFNSNLFWFYIKNMSSEFSGGYFAYTNSFIEPFPLPEFPEKPDVMIDLVNGILSLNKNLQSIENTFLNLLQSKFNIVKLSKKLQNWHELESREFIKELEKAHKRSAKENEITYSKISLSEEAEWMQYFNEQKEKAQTIKAEIDKTDREIDQMVYELYGLTEDEITIVEEANA